MNSNLSIRDTRNLPYSWQHKSALRKIQKETNGIELTRCLAVYLSITQISSDRKGVSLIETTVSHIGSLTGIKRQLVTRSLKAIAKLSLISMKQERGKDGKYLPLNVEILDDYGQPTILLPTTENEPIKDRPTTLSPSSVTGPYKKKDNTEENITKVMSSDAGMSVEDRTRLEKDRKDLLEFFLSKTESELGFKPVCSAPDFISLASAMKKYRKREIAEMILFYLRSEKAKKFGVQLRTIFSTHSINQFLQNKNTI